MVKRLAARLLLVTVLLAAVVLTACQSRAPETIADFSASPLLGDAPLAVSFTDLSSGDVSSWHWEFGDGQSSDLQNPSHKYSSAGTYSVSLTVSGESVDDSRVRPAYLQITLSPTNEAIIDCSKRLVQLCATISEVSTEAYALVHCNEAGSRYNSDNYGYTRRSFLIQDGFAVCIGSLDTVSNQLLALQCPSELVAVKDSLLSGIHSHQILLTAQVQHVIWDYGPTWSLDAMLTETETAYDNACVLWQAALDARGISYTDIGLTEPLLQVQENNIDFCGF